MGLIIDRIVRPGEVDVQEDDHWEGPCDIVRLAVDGDDDHAFRVISRVHFDEVWQASRFLAASLKGIGKTRGDE